MLDKRDKEENIKKETLTEIMIEDQEKNREKLAVAIKKRMQTELLLNMYMSRKMIIDQFL